jgi:proteasome-associated ATPase
MSFIRSEIAKVEWEDVAGLHDAKAALREAIERPVKCAHLYARYGKRPCRGVLLYGPPGCGKTMLGKAAAWSLKQAHAGLPKVEAVVNDKPITTLSFSFSSLFGGFTASQPKPDGGFFYVKAPEIQNCYVGKSEEIVRDLFRDARAYRKEHGHPAVVFVDEADAILGRRRPGHHFENSVVASFLAEMDGFDDAGAFVILATNRPNDLDAAVTREGRIDRRICVPRPDRAQAAELFRVHLRGRPNWVDHEWAAGELCSPARALYRIKYQSGREQVVALGDLVSGAAVASVVDRATEVAIGRDAARGFSWLTSGVRPDDVRAAVDSLEHEYRGLAHVDELVAIFEDAGEIAASVHKVGRDGAAREVVTDRAKATAAAMVN